MFASRKGSGTVRFDSKGEHSDTKISFAVRSSMSIPYFFTPTKMDGGEVFDGGIQNNLPIQQHRQIFGPSPFIGLVLYNKDNSILSHTKLLPKKLRSLLDIVLNQDQDQFIDEYPNNVIPINTSPVGTLDIDLSKDQLTYLIHTGSTSALDYISRKGFISRDEYIQASSKLDQLREKIIQT